MGDKSLKKNAFLNVINTFMKLLFPLITFPYVSRILSPEGIGKVNFANSVVSYFALIASLGIGTYGIRESAKIRNNKEEFSQFFCGNFFNKSDFYPCFIFAIISNTAFSTEIFFI